IAAQRGQRDEHLGGEREGPAAAPIAQRGRGGEEGGQALRRRREQRLGLGGVGRAPRPDAIERAPDPRPVGDCHCVPRVGSTRIMSPDSRSRPMARYWGYLASKRSTPREKSSPSVSSAASPWITT